MPAPSMPILTLAEMTPGQEADLFLLLTSKEELRTRNGKPYFKVAFRDAGRQIGFPLWAESAWAADCRDRWTPGTFYKVRAVYRETSFGPQLDIRKIREATDADAADGFDPNMCRPQSRFAPEGMLAELLALVRRQIDDEPLRRLVETILSSNREALLACPAARHNHHAFAGGLLEHTLSVTRSAVMLAEKYAGYYPDMQPPLSRGLVVAGAALHDIGKLRELDGEPESAYTPAGALVGHLLLGRDMVREAAAAVPIDAEALLRLEHILVAHQRLPEWGSPKPPMTPEALIVHYADDLDAKYHMMYAILRDDATPGPMTSKRNVLMQPVYRGQPADPS
jgi:3'-5' exoribonuclease